MQVSRQAAYNWLESDNISASSLTKLSRQLAVTEDWLKYGADSERDLVAKAEKKCIRESVK